MPKSGLNRPVWSWALYDWASSAFATTVLAPAEGGGDRRRFGATRDGHHIECCEAEEWTWN